MSPLSKRRCLVGMLLCLLAPFHSRAATVANLVWAQQIRGNGQVVLGNVSVDSFGNSYVAGTFSRVIQFTATSNALAGGEYDGFIAKYDSLGRFQWARILTSPGLDTIHHACLLDNVSLIIVGSCGQNAAFAGRPVTAASSLDRFVAKLRADGTSIWERTLGAGQNIKVATRPSGEIAVQWVLANPQVALLDSQGQQLWSHPAGGYGGVSFDSLGNILSVGGRDTPAYLEKRRPDGSVIWTQPIPRIPLAILNDNSDDILVGGTSLDSGRYFLRRLRASGDLAWAQESQVSPSAIHSLALNSQGNLYGAGTESGDSFLSLFNDFGSELRLATFGGQSPSLAIDSAGNSFIAAEFYSTIRLGDSLLAPEGTGDAFLAKFALQNIRDLDILIHPVGGIVMAGGSIALNVSIFSQGAATFQWRRNGQDLPGQTSRTLLLNNVTFEDTGNYDVVVRYNDLSLTSLPASVFVNYPPSVQIVSPAQGAPVRVGSQLAIETSPDDPFGAIAYVDLAINNTHYARRTQPPYTFQFVPPADGAYQLQARVSDAHGIQSLSSIIQIQAGRPPSFTRHPSPISAPEGSTVTFSASASGTIPFSYQWHKNDAPIPNETRPTLVLANTTAADEASYWVRAENRWGSLASNSASLTLQPAPADFILKQVNGLPFNGSEYAFNGAVTISLASSFPNGFVFYTLDGTPPTFASTPFIDPFQLDRPAVLRSVAYSSDFAAFGEGRPVTFDIARTFLVVGVTDGGGQVGIFPIAERHTEGSSVIFSATPEAGWTFLGWTGHLRGNAQQTTLRIDGPKLVRAIFGTPAQIASSGAGYLEVTPNLALYPCNSAIKITAIPEHGYYLALWGGSVTGDHNPAQLTVETPNPRLSALFAPLPDGRAALTVVERGGGSVQGKPDTSHVPINSTFTLTAQPQPGQRFLNWTGDIVTAQNPITVTLSASKVLFANFTDNPLVTVQRHPAPDGPVLLLTVQAPPAANLRLDSANTLPAWTPVETLLNTLGTLILPQNLDTSRPQHFFRVLPAAAP